MDYNTSHIFQNQQIQFYYSLFDALPDVTLIVDEQGVIVFANAQALPVLGYTPSEMLGLSYERLLPERYREAHAIHHNGYFKQPKLRPMGAGLPLIAQRKDGTDYPVEISLSPVATDQGTLVICALRDISERQKVEAAYQGDERFRLFLQHVPSAVAMFDRQMHYLAVSRRWLEDFRLTEIDIMGLCHYDVFPEIPEQWKEVHRRCLAGEALQGEEEIFLRADGQQEWVNWKMHPWHTEAGDIGGAILFSEVTTKQKKIERALHKSDERFHEIFKHAVTGIAITNSAGNYELFNPAYCNLLGYDQDELYQINFSSLIHPDDREANMALIRRLLSGELSNFEIENRYISKSGKVVWAQKFVSKLKDETDSASTILALVTNITDRKQHEAELLDSYAFNASILNSLTSHIAVLDAQGIIIAVNNAWRQFAEDNGLSTASQGLLGVNYLDACKNALHRPDGEEANAANNGIMAVLAGEKELFELEYPCHSPHQQRWFQMKVSPLEGSRRGVVVRHENITERKQEKLILQEKEQMLSESQRLAHIGSWSYDLATGFLGWSDETYNIFGATKETFGHTMEAFNDLIHPDDRNAMKMWLSDCLTGKTMQELDVRISLPDGSNRIIRGSGGLQLNDMKRPLRLAGSVQDITERVLREQQDQAHLEQLAHVTRLGLMSEMAAGITHEVNQPLSAISMYTQVSLNFIKTKDTDLVELREILVKTQQQALRAGEIIARMRDFLKPHAKPNTSADLNTLIQNSVGLCFSDIKEHNIQITLELDDDLPPIFVDPIQIEQIIINLIRNSIDALQSLPIQLQRQLSIQTQLMLSESIQVRVKDNGPGIPQDQQQKILTPFYTTKSTGMGMGLSISRSLIEAHAGSLHFNSQPGKGTTFYFTLPIQTSVERNETAVLEARLDQSSVVLTAERINAIDSEAIPSEAMLTIEQKLDELSVLLANDRFISDNLLNQLKKLLADDQQADHNRLCQLIVNTDYPKAQLLLKTGMGLSHEPFKETVQDPRSIILVVDDMRIHQEAMETLLNVDYQVKVAGNGSRALEICQCSPPPDLVLLDVNMPIMNGYEVCRKLQENRLFCEIPVIFVTPAAYQESEMQCLQLGAVDYITKPINPSVVLLRISNLLRLKQQEKELKRLAQYDTLTGIPNGLLLTDRMKQAIAQANRQQKMLCVCYLDLDGFKLINDTLGHQAGNHVLLEITQRIGHILREADTVARIGGDEFVVLLPNLNHAKEYRVTVKRLLETIALPVCIQDQSFIITASIGVSIFPGDNSDWDVLLRHADQAMCVAKRSGKNRYHLYDPIHD